MPLYMIERNFAEQLDLSSDDVALIDDINADEGVRWLFSFLSADRRRTYCLYEAPSREAIVAPPAGRTPRPTRSSRSARRRPRWRAACATGRTRCPRAERRSTLRACSARRCRHGARRSPRASSPRLALIAAETLLLFPLAQVADPIALGVVYLLGVLIVAIVWGAGSGSAPASRSALAFNFFHIPPTGRFTIDEARTGSRSSSSSSRR